MRLEASVRPKISARSASACRWIHGERLSRTAASRVASRASIRSPIRRRARCASSRRSRTGRHARRRPVCGRPRGERSSHAPVVPAGAVDERGVQAVRHAHEGRRSRRSKWCSGIRDADDGDRRSPSASHLRGDTVSASGAARGISASTKVKDPVPAERSRNERDPAS